MAARIAFLMFVTILLLILCQIILAERSSEVTTEGPLITCKGGSIRGSTIEVTHGKSVHQFLGIPYAEPPIGDLRFAAPKPAKPWTGIRDGAKYGPSCPQNVINMNFGNATWQTEKMEMSEDCLSLNVIVPADTNKDSRKAVMVWIYGGAFAIGATKDYNGTVLSALNDVIFVSINYRVSVFGFFNIPGTEVKGNYGMYDQILGLKWVQENIVHFGGDPGRVTIFGESAGGMSVSLLLLSPLTEGLFQRAIAQSGSAASPFCCHRVRTTKTAEAFAADIKCNMDAQIMDCLRSKTKEELLKAAYNYTIPGKMFAPFDIAVPVVDGEFLPDWPKTLLKERRFLKRDVILGFTRDEMENLAVAMDPKGGVNGTSKEILQNYVFNILSFTHNDNQLIKEAVWFQYQDYSVPHCKLKTQKALGDIGTDPIFHAPAIFEANAYSSADVEPFVYVFSHHPKYTKLPGWNGAFHGADLFFTFGEPVVKMQLLDTFPFVSGFNDVEKGLSVFIMKLWTNFAKYGNPNHREGGHDLVTWPKFTSSEEAYLNIALEPSVMYKLHPERMAFWNDFIPKLMDYEPKAEEKETKNKKKDEL